MRKIWPPDVLLPWLRRIYALRRGRCGQDHRPMGIGFVDSGEFRQRRGGQGQHRQHRRRFLRVRGMGFAPEANYIVHDASGKSIVIEYVGGKLNVYDNPLGVFTNSPAFDWHMTNLRNYVNFSMTNVPAVKLGSVTLEPFGQGSGMLGLPGDFTPPSRFVRAVAFSQSVLPSKTGNGAVLEAFHILNQFDIPKGASREHEKDAHGNVLADYTLWTSASDLKTKRYYFRTYDNSQIRMLDLMKMDLDAKDIVKMSIKGEEVIKPLNP